MSETVTIKLTPSGTELSVPRDSPLQDSLFAHGVEFPCGGHGRCKGCRIRVLSGSLPVTAPQEAMLSREELDSGWRLSCQCTAATDLEIELAQWEAVILSDNTKFTFSPRSGLGAAIDIGTTTVVGQLLDLQTGDTLAVRTALNPQARFGADVMSRVSHAMTAEGRAGLVSAIRTLIGHMLQDLLTASGKIPEELRDVVLVGNSVMHHLFCDFDIEPLSRYPFESPTLGGAAFAPQTLGWNLDPRVTIRFLPCIGGYVGSDILAGIVATGLHRSAEPAVLIDLGTNGEIVVTDGSRMVCCSTAAGPAFEGARIYMGMRAATGAIAQVSVREGDITCHVLGNVPPRGVCGSGLVDAVAAFLELGLVEASGRIGAGQAFLPLCPPVRISQTDIRELQLAKGAIGAGVRMLLQDLKLDTSDVRTTHLAGAFGNYVNTESAERIGLIRLPAERVHPAGNTALLGAKMALFLEERFFDSLAATVAHISLHAHPQFQEIYVEEMSFPSR